MCSAFSLLLTLGFSLVRGFLKMKNSIRFNDGGSYILGRIFWWYIFSRSRETIHMNEEEMRQRHPSNDNQGQNVSINQVIIDDHH
jgi:hypothetical protein